MPYGIISSILIAGQRGPVEVPTYTPLRDGLVVCEAPYQGQRFMLAHVPDETQPGRWAIPLEAWLPAIGQRLTVRRLTRLRNYVLRSATWAWRTDDRPLFSLTPVDVMAYFRTHENARTDMRRHVERALQMGYGSLPYIDAELKLIARPGEEVPS